MILRPLFFLMIRPPPRSTPYPTLFPYTTLFRSLEHQLHLWLQFHLVAPEHQLLQRSEEHTSELQSHSEISYAVFCLKKKNKFELESSEDALEALQSLLDIFKIDIYFYSFFFNDTATTEIYTLSYTLSLHDALPISAHQGEHGLVVDLLLVAQP